MKLLISGLVGATAACLIFTTIVLLPLHLAPKVLLGVSVGGGELLRLEGPEGVAMEGFHPGSACILNVTVYEFSRPVGPGSEADFATAVTSKLNYSEIFHVTGKFTSFADGSEYYEEHFPGRMEVVDGGSEWSWTGRFEANETKTFNHRIRAEGLGATYVQIKAALEPRETPPGSGIYYVGEQQIDLDFTVVPDDVLVRSSFPRLVPPTQIVGGGMDLYMPSYTPGVGNEFNVSILVECGNSTDLTLKIGTQEGIIPIEGQTTWTGNLTSYNEARQQYYVKLSVRMRIVKTGTWYMYATVEKNGIVYVPTPMVKFVVSEDSVMAYGLW